MVRMADWTSDRGVLFKKTRASKELDCTVCPLPILKGSIYERAAKPNAGLRAFIYADRLHEACHESYFDKY